MKVLHINSYYYGGKFYKNLYDEQIKDNLDIDVFVPVPYSYVKTDFDFGSYTTISANHNKYDRYLFHLKHYKIYKDIISKYKIEDYTIIHAHSLFSNGYIAMKLKQNYGIPYIVAIRNTDVNLFFKKMPYLRKVGIKILKEACGIVFLSKAYRDSVVETYVPMNIRKEILDKTLVIPNGVDSFWFQNKRVKGKTVNMNNISLLFVGAINKSKNLTTTVEAVKILLERGYDVRFTAVGKIKDESIYNKIKDLNFVNYIPYKSKEELLDIYRNSDIFVMPSIRETFGLVYAEAMTQGLPVIYTRGQGFDGQFEDGEVGYSVDCFNIEEIADKIICIIDNYSKLSKNCIEYSARFDWNDLEKEYRELYSNLLKK